MNYILDDYSRGLLSVLECPVCKEFMGAPITLCEHGHNICGNCRPRLKNCPTCRQKLLSTRNIALEELSTKFKYPCKYRERGCLSMFSKDVINDHETNCPFENKIVLVENASDSEHYSLNENNDPVQISAVQAGSFKIDDISRNYCSGYNMLSFPQEVITEQKCDDSHRQISGEVRDIFGEREQRHRTQQIFTGPADTCNTSSRQIRVLENPPVHFGGRRSVSEELLSKIQDVCILQQANEVEIHSCRYSDRGCKRRLPLELLLGHQTSCPYRFEVVSDVNVINSRRQKTSQESELCGNSSSFSGQRTDEFPCVNRERGCLLVLPSELVQTHSSVCRYKSSSNVQEYECANRVYGCKLSISRMLLADHEQICSHRPQKCPLREVYNCPWIGPNEFINRHIRDYHKCGDVCF
ncbi:hypothetical protein ANN_03479 [Periplaneta americana]|uniref:RING-type E3 ubiquitin transferase n=1 Tax=Periplaneta americana TaxID=6978 RepID=A0ABQ8U4P9_PERAM|nr:hypothetical protein ANN_03479 [Periplaneta americana]